MQKLNLILIKWFLDKNQREYVLREKMKVAKNQLKEFDGEDKEMRYEKALTEYPENIQISKMN